MRAPRSQWTASRPRAASHFNGSGLYGALRGGIGIQPMTEPLLPYKFIVHIAKAKAGLPIRGGLARAAGWVYLFKNYVLKDWVTFAEVYGQPLRVGKYGAGATEQDKETLLQAVANIGTDAAAIVPDSMLIEFTEARQTGSVELYQSFCQYLDAQISKAVLGQTLTTEIPQGAGSRAAAEVHDSVRRDILSADARRLAATINRDLVKPLVDLEPGSAREVIRAWSSWASRMIPDAQRFRRHGDQAGRPRSCASGRRRCSKDSGIEQPEGGEQALHPRRVAHPRLAAAEQFLDAAIERAAAMFEVERDRIVDEPAHAKRRPGIVQRAGVEASRRKRNTWTPFHQVG